MLVIVAGGGPVLQDSLTMGPGFQDMVVGFHVVLVGPGFQDICCCCCSTRKIKHA